MHISKDAVAMIRITQYYIRTREDVTAVTYYLNSYVSKKARRCRVVGAAWRGLAGSQSAAHTQHSYI
jgi:hypothetical protein